MSFWSAGAFLARGSSRAIQTTDFRPIASSRLFYKVFGYLILGRVEEILEAKQLEEQHGFRPGRRLEEHLWTANLLLDKTAAAGITVWIVSFDLSKAFDRVRWPTLWEALREQGVPERLVWLLENAYDGQLAEVMGEWGKSRSFSITGGVRQGCVLSPRLFTAVLEWALRQWRTQIGNAGFDLGDAFDNLVDLRFADDILLFANFGPEVAQILDKFVKAVGKVGLRLNVDKTVILTNEAQPPNTLVTKDGLLLNFGAESRAKMAKMHIDPLWKHDAALGSRLPHGTRHEIYARKPLDTAGQNNFNIYEAEIFQCLRVSSGLLWRWSPYTVQETTLYA